MVYDGLRTRLEGGLDARGVVALPDGSVDRYFAVHDPSRERVRTREAFADRVTADRVRSLQLSPEEVAAGGQAVNAARQVDALGAAVSLYGHLDAPAVGPFPFDAVSMGAPATVHVLLFDGEELMLSVESGDIRDWTLDDLFAAVGTAPDEWLSDEVVLVGNWVGFPGMTDALRRLADVDLGEATVVFDPGDVTATPGDPLRSLGGALASLGDAADVVLTANDRELARLAEALGVDAGEAERESRLREILGIDAVVLHYETHAAAATAGDERTVVENFEARRVVRRTGAGDRFDGGLAVGLAADLPWAACLALGNACATHFVEQGETASLGDVRRLLADRTVEE